MTALMNDWKEWLAGCVEGWEDLMAVWCVALLGQVAGAGLLRLAVHWFDSLVRLFDRLVSTAV